MADFAALTDVKAALDIASSDTSQDTVLKAALTTATAMIVDYLNRDPRADDFVERVSGRDQAEVSPRQYPINSVAAVSIDGTDVPLDHVDFDNNLIWLKHGRRFPRGRKNITVSYNAGLDPIPLSIKQAALYVIRGILVSRKADLNATGESWAGVNSVTWDLGGPGTIPPAARTLLRQYVCPWVPE